MEILAVPRYRNQVIVTAIYRVTIVVRTLVLAQKLVPERQIGKLNRPKKIALHTEVGLLFSLCNNIDINAIT